MRADSSLDPRSSSPRSLPSQASGWRNPGLGAGGSEAFPPLHH